MYSESVVYGCIRDWPIQDYDQQQARALHNRQALERLPAAETWSILARAKSFTLPLVIALSNTNGIRGCASLRHCSSVCTGLPLWYTLKPKAMARTVLAGSRNRLNCSPLKNNCACAAPGSAKAA